MPRNNVTTGSDGRKRYRYTDKKGKPHDLRQRQDESVQQFKKRCEKAEEVTTVNMTFDDLFSKWQTQYQKLYCSRADYLSMQDNYDLHIKDTLGHYKLHEITRSEVYGILSELSASGRSASLIAKVRSVVSRPYNWAINTLEYELTCPTAGLIMKAKKGEQKNIRVISDDEFDRFFAAAKNSKYYNYFWVLRYTGLRPSEAAGLQVEDDKGKYLSINRAVTEYELSPLKTLAAKRDVPVTKPLRKALNEQKLKTKGKWLFPSADGQPQMNAIVQSFKRILAQTAEWKKVDRKYHGELIKTPVDFNLYDFRHTFATNAARKLRPNQLQYIMGHSDIKVTLKYYVGLSNDDHNEASKALEKIFSKKNGTKHGTNSKKSPKIKLISLQRKTP